MRLMISDEKWHGLLAHMRTLHEHAAFMFARPHTSTELQVVESWLLGDDDYRTSTEDHLVLDDEVRPRVITHAHATDTAAIEAHSHSWSGQGTHFSPYDLRGLAEFAPHMLWRLPGRPYVALVIGHDSFDGLWWQTRNTYGTLGSVQTDTASFMPTGLSLDMYAKTQARGDSHGRNSAS
jgi:hypothetical protein